MNKLKTQSTLPLETGMLAFSRSIQISEGLFFGMKDISSSDGFPIEVHEKGVRGQSSDDGSKNPGKSNPQTVEYAVVPQGCHAIELRFTLRVLAHSIKPHACDNVEVDSAYQNIAQAYYTAGGYEKLATLYVWNLLNGRFAWRNRYQTDHARVRISFEGITLEIDPTEISLDTPISVSELADKFLSGSEEDLEHFISRFSESLFNLKKPLKMAVCWLAEMDPGQEIFPSQEYLREETQKKDLSRVYAKLPVYIGGRILQQASMHSQKINAAIRHIDVWHENDHYSAIAVNPYGGVQETSAVLRDIKSKRSFYQIRKNGQSILESIESASDASNISGNVHFFMANLVRGGVFGAKNTAKSKAKKNEETA